jgi:hypothetical protein
MFFSYFFSFPLLITIPPLPHTHLSLSHEVCNSPDQAAHYHTCDPKLGASSLTQHLAGLGIKVFFMCFLHNVCDMNIMADGLCMFLLKN